MPRVSPVESHTHTSYSRPPGCKADGPNWHGSVRDIHVPDWPDFAHDIRVIRAPSSYEIDGPDWTDSVHDLGLHAAAQTVDRPSTCLE